MLSSILKTIITVHWLLALYYVPVYVVLGDYYIAAASAVKAIGWAWLLQKYFYK